MYAAEVERENPRHTAEGIKVPVLKIKEEKRNARSLNTAIHSTPCPIPISMRQSLREGIFIRKYVYPSQGSRVASFVFVVSRMTRNVVILYQVSCGSSLNDIPGLGAEVSSFPSLGLPSPPSSVISPHPELLRLTRPEATASGLPTPPVMLAAVLSFRVCDGAPLRMLAPSLAVWLCFAVWKLPRSPPLAKGAVPGEEYTLMRSALARPTMLGRVSTPWALKAEVFDGSTTLPLSRLRGKLSRLPPKTEDGAKARTEALVSKEFRRRRLEELARVRMEALSFKALFAVAVL
jgi:hypothetical protein